ncbi:acetylornithine/succinyldiaminopimelate transaminase [Lysobacter sp. 5GHs7-4]|uniref:acetylornithine/succinyldiaminopimelate transaminase n=1 Tax=Lysobacter sp. 5GHs7-4 TaxID=2904253 RepID=UPI001E58560A|nr:acetylornithine/succinyldiaminopimelate transaminase [Lysobacter sp. 5GHs7-4]UHQ24129.1 acetylornithine/succinyldiaminopimelate transaminase [Lysobacter sp. 5GHs7-4]
MTASTDSLFALSERYYLPVYRPRRIVLERGQGARIWDRDGREYVDFGAGIAVNALGHAHPALIAALTEQAGKLWHTSNVFVSEPPLRLAEALVSASGFAERVFFCNSGAEANEAAIKLARKWATAQGREPERRAILSFRGSFHGRTLAAVTATAQPKYHEGFEPLPPGFRYSDFNDLAAAAAAMADGAVCAVLVEPVQGEGGVTPATQEFLQGLRALCDRHGALLILDEIQCGMGRSGRLFACHGYEVVPDVVTLAKALGSGFPIGAMLVGARAGESMQFGAHGTTFGGNPLAAAVANAALRELSSPALLANVERQSAALREALTALDREFSLFSEVRGRGLMLGAQLRPEHAGKAGEILDRCVDHGLLLLQAGPDVLRFVPALNIADADVAEGMTRLRAALVAFLGR